MALTLDINAAIQALNRNAGASSKHQCARYVRMALEAGGMDTSKRPSAAKNYHLNGYLKSIGFQQYQPQYGGASGYQTINAQPGDIEVQVYEPYGHICMYNGSIWVSDFRQAQASASKSRQGQGQYYYRFTGQITNSTLSTDTGNSGGGSGCMCAPSAGGPTSNVGSGGTGSMNAWQDAVIKMKTWYENNIHNYSQGVGKWAGQPAWTHCPLINQKTRHDCSGFVTSCLKLFGLTGWKWNTMIEGQWQGKGNEQWKMLESAGFTALPYKKEDVQAWDIINGPTHVEIYAGNNKSYSWGSAHPIEKGGMPSATSWIKYNVIWRYTGGGSVTSSGSASSSTGSCNCMGGSYGTGTETVRLKINWGNALRGGADYPANVKLTTTGWEVKGSKQSSYDPFSSVRKFNTLEKKSETITTAAPSESNFNHIKSTGNITDESINTVLINADNDITRLNETVSSGISELYTTIASGNVNPDDYKDLLQKTALNFRSLWDADKYTGILEAFTFECPVCGKKMRFIPLNGYCSLNCFLSDMKNQLISVKNSVTSQLKDFTESNISVVKDYLQMSLAMVNDLPGAMEDLELMSDSVQSYIQTRYNYLANKQKYFINKILIWKNNLLIAWLKEYINGVCRTDKLNEEPVKKEEPEQPIPEETQPEKADPQPGNNEEIETTETPKKNINDSINEAFTWLDTNIDQIGEHALNNTAVLDSINELSTITKNIQSIIQYKDKFYELYDKAYEFVNSFIQMVVPSDSLGFMGTTRSMIKNPMWPYYVDISCPASVKYSYPEKSKLYKSDNKQGATRPQLDRIKKLCDKIINTTFPPIQEFEYLMEPELFATRLIFSDQNFVAISKNISTIFNLFKGEPELLPEYKDLTIINIWYLWALYKGIVPTIQFTYGKIAPAMMEQSLT